jgi:hypothetical protein
MTPARGPLEWWPTTPCLRGNEKAHRFQGLNAMPHRCGPKALSSTRISGRQGPWPDGAQAAECRRLWYRNFPILLVPGKFPDPDAPADPGIRPQRGSSGAQAGKPFRVFLTRQREDRFESSLCLLQAERILACGTRSLTPNAGRIPPRPPCRAIACCGKKWFAGPHGRSG